jgi:hypothetical protein
MAHLVLHRLRRFSLCGFFSSLLLVSSLGIVSMLIELKDGNVSAIMMYLLYYVATVVPCALQQSLHYQAEVVANVQMVVRQSSHRAPLRIIADAAGCAPCSCRKDG